MGIKDSVLGVLNCSPVFHFSGDRNYGALSEDDSGRMSLFSIPLGVIKLYLITYCIHSRKFSFWKVLKFSEVCFAESDASLKIKKDEFVKLMASQSSNYIENQKAFLLYLLSGCAERISIGYNKVNTYTAIFVVFVGFVFNLLGGVIQNYGSSRGFISVLVSVVLVLMVINYGAFLFYVLRVKGYFQSRFSEFKSNPTQSRLVAAIYYDWISKSNEANVLISIVRNVEKYAILGMFWAVNLWVAGFEIPHDVSNSDEYGNVYRVFGSEGRFDSSQFSMAIKGIEMSSGDLYVAGVRDSKNLRLVLDFLDAIESEVDVKVIELDDKVDPDLVYIKR